MTTKIIEKQGHYFINLVVYFSKQQTKQQVSIFIFSLVTASNLLKASGQINKKIQLLRSQRLDCHGFTS